MTNFSKIPLNDIVYDTTAQDWSTSGGDLAVFNTSHENILSALLLDAFESQFNSMKFVLRNWGFEGRSLVYTSKNNEIFQKTYLYIKEIIGALSFLIIDVKAITPTFPLTTNTFSIRIECVLNDINKTAYDHTLTWNGGTLRASIV